MITAVSSPNIALIKYWGNRNDEWRLPAADSLSMVLNAPRVEVSVEASDIFSVRSYDAQGSEKQQSQESLKRLKTHWELSKEYLGLIHCKTGIPKNVSLVIHSQIPPAIGIASSAAVFSCLAEAYGGLVTEKKLSRQDVSILGRLGSGSGARNVFGGFVALTNHGEGIGSTHAENIADEQHWPLHDIIIVPSTKEKKVGSTEGHAMAATSPRFKDRIASIPKRMQECIAAISAKDFEKLRYVSEEDSLDMHSVMQTQIPPLNYVSEETHRIIRDIESLRSCENLEVLCTMDAGPTVHLICTEGSVKAVTEFAETQKGCVVFKTKTGGRSKLL